MPDVAIVTVSERGQLVMPKKTRERLGFGKGVKLMMVEEMGKVTFAKLNDIIKTGAITEGLETFIASEKSLKKDWSYKGDDVWDDL